MIERIERPDESKNGMRNGSSLPSLAPELQKVREFQKLIRELQKVTEAMIAKLTELVKEEGEKLNRKVAEVVNAAIVAEARERDDNAKIRAALNTVTGGAVERLVR